MQFGMPTLIELKSTETCAALCHELGLSFVELSMDMPEYQADKLDVDELRRIANEYKIFYTIHLEGFLDPCVFNRRVAAAYTETALQVIEISKQLKVPLVNMHMNRGDHFTLPDKKVSLYDEYISEYLQKLTSFRNDCAAEIGNADIKICVENCGTYKTCKYMVDGLDVLLENPSFSLTFDIGHDAGESFTDEPVIMNRIDRLCHMHVHDAIPAQKRDHLTLGTGELDLQRYLKLADQHHCRCVLETKTVAGLRQSVAWLRERGFL
jgi:sugar phosphate isomerase/epimerase